MSEEPPKKLPEFDAWYALYPRKCGRFDAEKAYNQQLKKGYTHAALLDGVRLYRNLLAVRGTDRAFIPYPATWLRAGCWLDEELKIAGAENIFVGDRLGGHEESVPADLDPLAGDLSRRIGLASFKAYFQDCAFTDSKVLAPTQARKDMILNKFAHRIPSLIVEVASGKDAT